MRIISGKYKGKKIEGFDIIGTRPTMDRVKESLFGMIQNKIQDSVCLDLFAGSGALGMEAISNGCKKSYFVDNNEQVIKILKQNLKDMDNYTIIKSDAFKFLKNIDQKFDIIFLDPPYKYNLINKAISTIIKYDLLADDGIIVCEYETEHIECSLELIKEKKYGSKNIKIFKK